ncbi:hypothetical protein Q4R22_11880 [Morganella morganii subsp. sibonii]|uniref:hypothetical protein n=1 Tax=Morganella morganii TaxID=582 RepID=UPI0030D4599A|nr:hypothetical protein [Morganella morganii]
MTLTRYFRVPDGIHPAVIHSDSDARIQYTWSENTERYIPSGSDTELTGTPFYIPPGHHPLSDGTDCSVTEQEKTIDLCYTFCADSGYQQPASGSEEYGRMTYHYISGNGESTPLNSNEKISHFFSEISFTDATEISKIAHQGHASMANIRFTELLKSQNDTDDTLFIAPGGGKGKMTIQQLSPGDYQITSEADFILRSTNQEAACYQNDITMKGIRVTHFSTTETLSEKDTLTLTLAVSSESRLAADLIALKFR